MRRLLVTGGAGFIGANFVHYWLRQHPGDRIVVLDALTYAGNLANLSAAEENPGMRFVRGDICDRALVQQLLREDSLDTIVHFAAESHVDRSIVAPDAFIRTNVLGTHSLLEAARQVWLVADGQPQHRFHHVSTDEVYGSLGPRDPPFIETTAYAPNSPYAASKAASDHLVRVYSRTYGLKVTVTNCSNNYGPFQFPEKLIPLTITNILDGHAVPVYGDGRNVRDWLHVRDHCRALERVLTDGASGEVYNIGGRSECENIELVGQLCEIADEAFGFDAALRSRFPDCPASKGRPATCLISFISDRPGHDRRYSIDGRKIEAQLGFAPQTTLRPGLVETFKWYLEHEGWWRRIKEGAHVPCTTSPPANGPGRNVPSER